MIIKSSYSNTPVWREIHAHAILPESLKSLNEIAHTLWWVWNEEAKSLFEEINPKLWQESEKNPVHVLRYISSERIDEITKDAVLMAKIEKVSQLFNNYMSQEPDRERPSIAYFSMEYGLTHVLKIYSGGLGVLAGDYLKEASDSNVDMTAVGLLYRYGYFKQILSSDGQQVADYEYQMFGDLPINPVLEEDGSHSIIEVPFPGRTLYARIWRVAVGRVNLYLLDTDIEQNNDDDKSITHHLYGGDWENRMKQESLLGIGGILALKKLGIKKDVYHCNEGHAAFINVQRICDYIEESNISFSEALEVVRASSLYTVHTPVPAGHDSFDEDLMGRYLGAYAVKMGLSWSHFMDMGRENPGSHDKFSMSVFALNTCQEANGVSKLHGTVSQHMFQPIWNGYLAEELHVGYVTNGIHLPTWSSYNSKRLFEKYFDSNFFNDQSNPEIWKKAYDIPSEDIWELRLKLKERLVGHIKRSFVDGWLKNQANPSRIMSILDNINPNALLIGFGRRFATYKRAHLLFHDLERLAKIVNNPEMPVQFIFTGKAHPADGGGQGLIKHIVEISRRPEFLGKIIFLENYDMRLAKRLISGVDVWLNTPTRPLEASGTSGEKAEVNGVLNFSVLDGWWYEGYREGAGWALTDKRSFENQQYQDELDALTIYSTFENQIIPTYFERDENNIPNRWVDMIKKSFAEIAPHYTTKRMMDDYFDKFYNKQGKRVKLLSEDNFKKAKEIALWKEEMANKWDNFEIVKSSIVAETSPLPEDNKRHITASVIIDKKDLNGDLGVECVVAQYNSATERMNLKMILPFDLVKTEGSLLYFEAHHSLSVPGIHKYALRVYPKNPDLPHRMDFAYVRWIN